MRRLGVLAMLLLCGCGPKPLEVGSTALASAIVALIISSFVVHHFARLWRRVRREVPITLRALRPEDGVVLALHAIVSAAALVGGELMDGAGAGLIIIVTSHLSFTLILWRIFQARAFLSATIASLLCLAPALPMVLSKSQDAMDFGIVVWIITSYWGAVPTVIAVVLLIEAYIRRDQSPPPDPTADVFD